MSGFGRSPGLVLARVADGWTQCLSYAVHPLRALPNPEATLAHITAISYSWPIEQEYLLISEYILTGALQTIKEHFLGGKAGHFVGRSWGVVAGQCKCVNDP